MTNYSGKTLADAIAAACKAKNVDEANLTYTVVEEKAGFLGIGKEVTIEAYCFADVVSFVKEYLDTYFKGLNREVDVNVTIEDGFIKVMLNAENNAILIGKGGETLKAINTVTRNAASSYFKHRYNILVDINGYKEDRYAKVVSLAKRVAKTVQKTHQTATLDPLPNDERKVIHQTLSDWRNIRTESVGERNDRRVQIIYDENK